MQNWYATLDYDQYYVYDYSNNVYKPLTTEKDPATNKITGYKYLDGSPLEDGVRKINSYSSLVSSAESQFAKSVSDNNIYLMIIFIIVLLLVLISMATFRSPAVALMPDVTLKPLRSKANAIINLMGTAGGIVVLGLGMIFQTGAVKNQMMSYTWFVSAVCGIMAIALVVFVFTVKEKKWNAEMLEQQALLDAEEEKENEAKKITAETSADENSQNAVTVPASKNKMSKDKLRSLILILARDRKSVV